MIPTAIRPKHSCLIWGVLLLTLVFFLDNEVTINTALKNAEQRHDLLITSGGVSEGEEDHVKAAVGTQGTVYLWRLAIKPGRPIALGQVGNTAFIGLPGNPVAAMVTFMVIGA